MTDRLYALPGWGFDACIFDGLLSTTDNWHGLNYIQCPYQSFDDWVETLAEDIKDDSHLLGWSFGGLLAIAITRIIPKRIKTLTLLASSPRMVNPLGNSAKLGMNPEDAQAFMQLAKANFAKAQQQLYRLCAHPIRERTALSTLKSALSQNEAWLTCLPTLFNTDLQANYANLSVPTLHLLGDKDALLPVDPQALHQLYPNVKVISIQNAGHGLLISHPQQCLKHMEAHQNAMA